MSERPYHITVDLGPAAHGALEEMMAETSLNRSEVIRMVIEMSNLLDLVSKWDELSQQLSQQVIPSLGKAPSVAKKVVKAMTDYEKQVISAWRRVFKTEARFYIPPAVAVIRAAKRNGMSYQDLIACVEVAPQDDYIQSIMVKGRVPQPHEVLSERLLGRLMPLAELRRRDEINQVKLSLESTIKPAAVMALREAGLPNETFALAWRMIQEATSQPDVESIAKAAIENTLDELLGRETGVGTTRDGEV